VPETKEMEIQLDGREAHYLEILAREKGMTPEQLGALILNKELDRMTRPPATSGKVRSIGRKG
jgi:hypothetical protein